MQAGSDKESELKKHIKRLQSGILSSSGKRCDAAKSLERLGDDKAVPHLIKALEKEKDENVIKCISNSLVSFADPCTVPVLFAKLFQVPGETKKAVLSSIDACISDENIDFFIKTALSDKLHKRKLAIKYLGKLESTDAISDLLRLLNDKEEDIRTTVMSSLESFPPEHVILHAENEMKNADRYYAIHIAELLDSLNSPLAVPILLDMLESNDPILRSSAAKAIDKCADESSVGLLMDSIEHDSPNVKCFAVKKLLSLGGKVPIETLMALLEDKNDSVRSCAVEGLAAIEDPAILDILKKVMQEDNDGWVRKLAANSVMEKENRIIKESLKSENDKGKNEVPGNSDPGSLSDATKQNKNSFSYCLYCGKSLDFESAPVFCPFCGQRLPDSSKV